MNYRKKLIEVALPLEAINAAARREKSITHGHPSSFHHWWARLPLAATTAVLFASLIDDPSSHSDRFPDEDSQKRERLRLFEVIRGVIQWENMQNQATIEAARTEILNEVGSRLPIVLDPFAGGGTIPLSAQLLGLNVRASDLNPVAVLINKALIELPSKFSGKHPIGPDDFERLHQTDWPGVSGLVEDILRYSRWIDQRARELIGRHYPTVALPSSEGGGRAIVIAWIWARTTTCSNPACGCNLPLLNSFTLSRRKNNEAWLAPIVDGSSRSIRFVVNRGSGRPKGGTVTRDGATCLLCGFTTQLKDVRASAQEIGFGAQLICTVAQGVRRRIYVDADTEQLQASQVEISKPVLGTSLPQAALGFRVQGYGITTHDQLFTPRQLHTLKAFTDLVGEAREKIMIDGGTKEYADAITTYLGLCISRLAHRGSSQCRWNAGGDKVEPVFSYNALQMIWTYAEANPFSDSSGNFIGQVRYLTEALLRVPATGSPSIEQIDARVAGSSESTIICTDPPYYDNVPYADLSDFFYVWLRRCLKDVYPDLFSTILVPKHQELISEPARHDGKSDKAATYFRDGLRHVFQNLLTVQNEEYPFTVFYAFKQSEGKADKDRRSSTGWETMLQGLIDACAVITGTWPMATQMPGRLRELGSAALASSIVLVCRRRPDDAPLTTRLDFLTTLRAELPDALRRLQQGNIAPVDLAQASIGPGMAVFSRYSKVIEADGTAMPVRAALAVINQVLDEVLASQEADFDGDTRWAVAWFEQHGLEEGSAGVAETLSKAKNTSISGLVQAGILEQRGNKCRLLSRGELDEDWTPGGDDRITVWEVVQHLIRTLEAEGEAAAGALLASVGGLGEPARELAYRLYSTCEKKGWSEEALAYNGLVVAWPELVKRAAGGAGDAVRLF